jgi:hypothetical protein
MRDAHLLDRRSTLLHLILRGEASMMTMTGFAILDFNERTRSTALVLFGVVLIGASPPPSPPM